MITIQLDDGRRYTFPIDDDLCRISFSYPIDEDVEVRCLRRDQVLAAAREKLPGRMRRLGVQTLRTPLFTTEFHVYACAGTYHLVPPISQTPG